MGSKIIIFFVGCYSLLVFSAITADGQNVRAILSNAQLPTPRGGMAGVYDGEDSIYLFGGFATSSGDLADVLKYSIAADTIQRASYLDIATAGGGAAMDSNRNIYYFGGRRNSNIYQYFPDNQSFIRVGSFPHENEDFGLVMPSEDTALLIGGYYRPRDILSLNLTSLESEVIATIPKEQMSRYSASAVWVEEKQAVYILDGTPTFPNVTKFNPITNNFEILTNYFPRILFNYYPKAIWQGRHGYVFGGISNDIPYHDNIIQFDPEDGNVNLIKVLGYPGTSASPLQLTTPIYVEKLNRVYLFGGYHSGSHSSEIWYIDLDPVSPPGTTSPPVTTTELTCPPCPTEQPPSQGTCPPDTLSKPEFTKAIYQHIFPLWPSNGTVIRLGISASTPGGEPIQYELLSQVGFLELTSDQQLVLTSDLNEGSFVGPNNVLVAEVRAEVVGDPNRKGAAGVVIVFPGPTVATDGEEDFLK